MSARQDYIAVQQLQELKKSMSADLYIAFDLLSTRLFQGHINIPGLNSTRQYAELREARKIVLQLKHPDTDLAIYRQEMMWALYKLIEASEAMALYPVAMTMRAVARKLGLDVVAQHDIPLALDKQIGNAVKVLQHTTIAAPALAVAV